MDEHRIWQADPPPRSADVWAKFDSASEEWHPVRTCKRGCCVRSYRFGENMILPRYWKPRLPDDDPAKFTHRAWPKISLAALMDQQPPAGRKSNAASAVQKRRASR